VCATWRRGSHDPNWPQLSAVAQRPVAAKREWNPATSRAPVPAHRSCPPVPWDPTRKWTSTFERHGSDRAARQALDDRPQPRVRSPGWRQDLIGSIVWEPRSQLAQTPHTRPTSSHAQHPCGTAAQNKRNPRTSRGFRVERGRVVGCRPRLLAHRGSDCLLDVIGAAAEGDVGLIPDTILQQLPNVLFNLVPCDSIGFGVAGAR
jgi:hypothetical protein